MTHKLGNKYCSKIKRKNNDIYISTLQKTYVWCFFQDFYNSPFNYLDAIASVNWQEWEIKDVIMPFADYEARKGKPQNTCFFLT